MIAFLNGKFAVNTPSRVVVDVNGVGYDVQISLHTFSAISNKPTGMLHTYLHITENAQTLFGFATIAEKDLFLQLISVSGVGASTARMMLSGMVPQEIIQAIVSGNVKQLESIKGIGKKSAERLIVELRDKLGKLPTDKDGLTFSSSTPENTIGTDALQALISLGIARPAAEQAIKKAIFNNKEIGALEDLIKIALKNL